MRKKRSVPSTVSELAAMLLPALGKARDKARGVSCTNKMKQIGLGTILYGNDFDEHIPAYSNGGWYYQYRVLQYLGHNERNFAAINKQLRCPSYKPEPTLGGKTCKGWWTYTLTRPYNDYSTIQKCGSGMYGWVTAIGGITASNLAKRFAMVTAGSIIVAEIAPSTAIVYDTGYAGVPVSAPLPYEYHLGGVYHDSAVVPFWHNSGFNYLHVDGSVNWLDNRRKFCTNSTDAPNNEWNPDRI